MNTNRQSRSSSHASARLQRGEREREGSAGEPFRVSGNPGAGALRRLEPRKAQLSRQVGDLTPTARAGVCALGPSGTGRGGAEGGRAGWTGRPRSTKGDSFLKLLPALAIVHGRARPTHSGLEQQCCRRPARLDGGDAKRAPQWPLDIIINL